MTQICKQIPPQPNRPLTPSKKGASGYAKSQTSELASLAPVPGNMDYDSLTAMARGVLEKWNDCITNEAKKIISIDKTLHESDRTNAQRFR